MEIVLAMAIYETASSVFDATGFSQRLEVLARYSSGYFAK
jgi:hypothetical protein